MKKLFWQIVKFGVVGVVATLIDLSVLVFLKECLHVDVLLASAAGFAVSVTANYLLSMLFVFQSKGTKKVREFVIFVSLSIGGLALHQFLMWLGCEVLALYYLLVKLFATCVVTVYNFITRKLCLEQRKKEDA